VAAKAEIRRLITASGFRDGLGERVIAFDRPTGEVRDRLRVRPEIAAFETALGAQIDRVSRLTDPRFPRARDVDRDRVTGQVVVVSDYVPGERLSDLLNEAHERGVFPDIAAALQTAGELLLAMASFSGALKMVHGAIAPSRIVLSETGDVALTDYLFGPILPRFRFSPPRLWSDLGIAGGSDGGVVFDEASDARQIALVLIAMALGRPIRPDEYPAGIPALVAEVCDVALISGGDRLATGLRAWLERALNLEGRQAFGNMAHACASFGQLTFDGGGLAGSRAALVAFLADVARPAAPAPAAPPPPPAQPPPIPVVLPAAPPVLVRPERVVAPEPEPEPVETARPVPDLIVFPDSESFAIPDQEPGAFRTDDPFTLDWPEPEPVAAADPEPIALARTEPIATAEPEPIVVAEPEPFAEPEPVAFAESEPLSAEPAFDLTFDTQPPPVVEPLVERRTQPPPHPVFVPPPMAPPVTTPVVPVFVAPTARVEPRFSILYTRPTVDEPEPPVPAPEPAVAPEAIPVVAEPPPAAAVEPPAPAVPEPEAVEPSGKKKKKPRRLKLRRRDADPPTPTPTPAPSYLLPDLAPPGVAPLPPPSSPFPSVMMPDIPPPGVVPLPPPAPIFPAIGGRTLAAPVLTTPAPPAPIRLKEPSPEVVARARRLDRRHVPYTSRPDAPSRPPVIAILEPSNLAVFKIVAVLIVLAVAGFAAFKFGWSTVSAEPGRLTVETTPSGSQVYVDGELKGKTPLTIPVAAGKHELKLTRRGLTHTRSVVVEEGKTRLERYTWTRARPPGRGGLRVSSEPPGAKVFVDGKLQGETPLDLPNTPVGTHTVVLESSIGSVRRTVTVVRGEQALVDVELYSGFVKVFAPIELELSVNGRSVGNGSEPIMLPPGEQEILAVNRDMGYREVHTVDVEPGETRTLTITPVGRLTVTAVPWAEVWIDETRAGRTPLTNRRVPIGTHTLILRHPDHGERRVVATVTHAEPTAVRVDLTKP
jgi:PEGA domain